jgi:formylglycine-generating enzyme required for sulfatase activity
MVLIPPGTFNMGCSASDASAFGYCNDDERPIHPVTLTNILYLGRYEVTQAQWTGRMGSNPSFWKEETAEVAQQEVPLRPVESVSWNMTQGFLSGTGLRLPSEAEWEYAYRSGTSTAFHGFVGYPNGTNDDGLASLIAWHWTTDCGSVLQCQTRPVGRKLANGFGLHDMSGNVQEWVNDWFGGYPSTAQTNPAGPVTGTVRVIRGGGWNNWSGNLRSSFRNRGYTSDETLGYIGFRVARNP